MKNTELESVALVTGGASGIGAATVRKLVRQGHSVVIADLNEHEGRRLASELGERARFVVLDVVQEDSWARAMEETQAAFGAVTVLVNNAGVVHNEPLEVMTEAAYRRVLDVNQVGVFLGMKSVVAGMRVAGGGTIINISSVAGIIAFPNVMGYVASKWAVRGMSKAAAQELGQYGIRVNSVHPGVIDTPMTAGTNSAAQTVHQPLGHPGEPEDIAGAVAYLASPAAKYVTGTELVVDGGFTSM